jgi:trimeric autotransporter adhesin
MASSGGGSTASTGGGSTASAPGSAASGNGATGSGNGSTASAPGSAASGNGATGSGNGAAVGAVRSIVPVAWDGTGQQGGQLAQQPTGQDGTPPTQPAQQPTGQDGTPPTQPVQQPTGQTGAPTPPDSTGDTGIDGIQSWPLPGAASPPGQPPAQQGQPPANPAPGEVTSLGIHGFLFAGPALEVTAGNPVKAGAWGFGGGYVEAGFSNIGTNTTFDGGHGYIVGGGLVGGANVAGQDVDLEGGILWEKGTTDWSWPLFSGGTAQNTNQWSDWSSNAYGGIVVGSTEVGALYGCNGQSCTATLLYGKAWPDRGFQLGFVNVKPQLWGGAGVSFTWPSTSNWPAVPWPGNWKWPSTWKWPW